MSPSVVFGQIVIGPPGSGKTKYCSIMQETLGQLGRSVYVVNLDPANDYLYYDCALNIFDLINIQDVMANLNLGPNGSLIYCMEFLEENMQWLVDNLARLVTEASKQAGGSSSTPYFLFDLPGQVELYTHHKSIRNIIAKLTTSSGVSSTISNKSVSLDCRLCCVNLVDSYYASDPAKFISVLLMSLNTMIQIELPHVNILSKMDLIKQYGKLAFSLDYYTDVLDLKYLVETLDSDQLFKKYKRLNDKLCDIVQDFSLVSFAPLNIQKKKSIVRCIKSIDRANGFIYGNMNDEDIMNTYCAEGDLGFEDDDDDDQQELIEVDNQDI